MPLFMRYRIRGHSYTNLYLFQRLLIPQDDFGNNFWSGAVKAVFSGNHSVEMLADQIHKMLMIQMSSRSNDHVPRNKTLSIKIDDRCALEAPNRIAGAQNRTAERVVFPKVLSKDFMNEVVGIVLIHLDFFQDDTAFTRDVLRIKCRIKH